MGEGRGQRGSVRQLPGGRWEAVYREGGRGSRKRKKRFDTKRDAEAWLLDRLAEVDAVRKGTTSALILEREAGLTVATMIERYLEAHEADAPTLGKLAAHGRRIVDAFGDRLAASVEPHEWATWRKTLPPGYAFDVIRSGRQFYAQAVRNRWVRSNPLVEVVNPKPRRREVQVPTWEAVWSIVDEMDSRYAAAPIVLAGAGLRIEEFLALEKRDLFLESRVLQVRRVWSSGRLLELGPDGSKSEAQRRNVPLRQLVVDAFEGMRPRVDTAILFPAPRGGDWNRCRGCGCGFADRTPGCRTCNARVASRRYYSQRRKTSGEVPARGWKGGYLSSDKFLARIWTPAVEAAGVDYFPPKDLRHLYASEMLANGIPTLTVARRMGTSLQRIQETYGHLIDEETDVELAAMDGWDSARAVARKVARK
jgi:integrase